MVAGYFSNYVILPCCEMNNTPGSSLSFTHVSYPPSPPQQHTHTQSVSFLLFVVKSVLQAGLQFHVTGKTVLGVVFLQKIRFCLYFATTSQYI